MPLKRSRFTTVLRFVIPILVTLLWLSFIYSNSLKNGEESSEQSGTVHEIVNDIADNIGIEEPIEEADIRTGAHFLEFAVLSFLLCCDLVIFRTVTLKKKLYVSIPILCTSVPVCFILACTDEFLQRFSEDRGPSMEDVMTDTLGALCALAGFIVLFVSVFTIRKIIKKKTSL